MHLLGNPDRDPITLGYIEELAVKNFPTKKGVWEGWNDGVQ